MGELDSRPFLAAMKNKYNKEQAEERASELCSLWEEYLKDPDWHPFKIIRIDGKEKEIINEDKKLNGLKNEMGERAYKAVVAALTDINESNPSGRYISIYPQNRIMELWTGKENNFERRSTICVEAMENT